MGSISAGVPPIRCACPLPHAGACAGVCVRVRACVCACVARVCVRVCVRTRGKSEHWRILVQERAGLISGPTAGYCMLWLCCYCRTECGPSSPICRPWRAIVCAWIVCVHVLYLSLCAQPDSQPHARLIASHSITVHAHSMRPYNALQCRHCISVQHTTI